MLFNIGHLMLQHYFNKKRLNIFAIEEAFDIQIPFNANEPSDSDFNISSVASIISGIEKLVAEKT